MHRIFVIYLIILIIALGCSKDNSVNPPPVEHYTVTFAGLPDSLKAPTGSTRRIPFSIQVFDENEIPISDYELQISLSGVEGEITPEEGVSDQSGIYLAELIIQVADVSVPVHIVAAHAGGSATATINLFALSPPGRVTLSADREQLFLPDGVAGEINFRVIVTNTSGIGLEGINLLIELLPVTEGASTFGSLQLAESTDSLGRTDFAFNSGGSYGQQIVKCAVDTLDGGTEESFAELLIDVQNIRGQIATFEVSSSSETLDLSEESENSVEIYAEIKDFSNRPLPGINVSFNTEFGQIDAVSLSDSIGIATALYSLHIDSIPMGNSDSVIIAAEISETQWLQEVAVMLVGQHSGGILTVATDYDHIHADSGLTVANIEAVLKDRNTNVLAEKEITFLSTQGVITSSDLTDSLGIARAVFTDTGELTYDEVGNIIPATITVQYGLGGISTVIEISILERGFLTLTTDVDTIYADYGITTATLMASLKDEDHRAMYGEEIIFSSSLGSVTPNVRTNTNGIAQTIFADIGQASVDNDGNIIPVTITAIFLPWNLSTETQVTILEVPMIQSITLSVDEMQLVANSGDSTIVSATCLLENNTYALAGTRVYFESTIGTINNDMVEVQGNLGIAETHFVAADRIGTAMLRAHVITDDEWVFSNEVEIEMTAGPAYQVSVTAEPSVLFMDELDTSSTITALVTDVAGFLVSAGTVVTFETTQGNLDLLMTRTDENGRAVAHLSAGIETGYADITATVDGLAGPISGQARVLIRTGGPNRLEITSYPGTIFAPGIGANSYSTITAFIYDSNDNLSDHHIRVVFQLLNEPDEPEGCNFNNAGQIFPVQTNNGIAEAILNAGIQTGVRNIRVYTWRSEERADTVSGSDEIEVSILENAEMTLVIDTDFIYADMGRTVANLWVSLQDAGNAALPQEIILLTTTHGVVTTPVLTDSLGRANAVFSDIGLPSVDEEGNPVPAIITARYPPLDLERRAEIFIFEVP